MSDLEDQSAPAPGGDGRRPDARREPSALEQRVRERTRDLVEINGRLEAEIAERTRVEKRRGELLAHEQALRAAAEDASRLKDEFLATISHELRTPLNVIVGWTAALRTGKLDGPALGRALDIIERNVWAQKHLIDGLLDVSHILAGTFELETKRVDLRRIVRGVVEAFRPAAQAKGIALVSAPDPPEAPVRGDPVRLRQVLSNLLANALEFTGSGGTVDVALACTGAHAEIVVSDTGEGIASQFLPHVFDRFRQQDGSIARRHGGLGLGLAIARDLVGLHGGTIRAASAGEGKGAVFTVCLPVGAAGEDDGADDDALRVTVPDDPSTAPLQGLSVLAIDDDEDTLAGLRLLLEQHGARVTAAASAREGLERLVRQRPDVLVADIGMPDLDGYGLIEQVRALDPGLGGRTPAVALTAHATFRDRLRALEAGYQHHLAKPVHPEDLAVVILSAVRSGDEHAPAGRSTSRA